MSKIAMDAQTFGLMQTGKPLKTYKKTILGQVYCSVLNSFSNEPEGILLSGDPTKNDPLSMFDIWNDMQDAYFRRANKKNLEMGVIIAFERPDSVQELEPEPFATATDEEIDEILTSKYYTILSALNKCTNTIILNRFLQRARVLEKSEKIIKSITSRISELQSDGSIEE